jgi:hypothetical protein
MTLSDKVYELDYQYARRISFTPFIFRFVDSCVCYIYFYDRRLPNGDIPYICMTASGRYVCIDEFTAQTTEIVFLGLWK